MGWCLIIIGVYYIFYRYLLGGSMMERADLTDSGGWLGGKKVRVQRAAGQTLFVGAVW